jgi:hypothetical protein
VDAASVIPELVRLTDLHVRVPRFGVLALGRIAQREGTTVSEVIARQLLDLIAEQPEPLERSIAGLAGAIVGRCRERTGSTRGQTFVFRFR